MPNGTSPLSPPDPAHLGREVMQKLDQAAEHSEPSAGVTRLFCTKEHAAVATLIRQWMAEAGLQSELDDAGNIVGRDAKALAGEPSLILGSHQDTVVDGGKYDGMLGVVLPLVCLRHLREAGVDLPFGIEAVAFGDEEGTRFQSTLVGSRALAGINQREALQAKDADGVTLGQALESFGCDPAKIPAIARDPQKALGFVEVHIEQGPVLENEDLPVGIVTAMTGIERHSVTFRGKAGHAGTVPMDQRHDALVAASHAVAAIDELFQSTRDLVGVVGKLEVRPNAVNVIPAEVAMTVEVRSPDDAVRLQARETLREIVKSAASRGRAQVEIEQTYEAQGVACAEWLMQALEQAAETNGIRPHRLFSGAGHDGLAMAQLCDIAMLFVRCRDGLSHHPDESITEADAGQAAAVLLSFLQQLEIPG